jgi:hypothetical protein
VVDNPVDIISGYACKIKHRQIKPTSIAVYRQPDMPSSPVSQRPIIQYICNRYPAEGPFTGFSLILKNIMFSVCPYAEWYYVINSLVVEKNKISIASGISLRKDGSNDV